MVSVHDAWWLSEHQFLLDSNDQLVDSLQANPFTVLKTADNTAGALSRFQYLSEQLQGAKKIIARTYIAIMALKMWLLFVMVFQLQSLRISPL